MSATRRMSGSDDNDLPAYPIKPYRYFRYGLYGNSESCYIKEEVVLLNYIELAYHALLGTSEVQPYFKTLEEKAWYDWWVCIRPAYDKIKQYPYESFTLPSRENSDPKQYPLGFLADNMARQIANWQGKRVKDQLPERMNDPVMLVFEELRDWFFNDLGQKECTQATLADLAKRLSYIKTLIHLIPNFGPDRPHLLEVQQGLEQAATIVQQCIANKELPQLLSDLIRSGINLETIIGTYLHFLLIDEEVADNFSAEHLDGSQRHCYASPVCKIHKAAEMQSLLSLGNTKSQFLSLSKFYQMKQPLHSLFRMELNKTPVAAVKFADFVSINDKDKYLDAIATLDTMLTVRKTLEKFHHIQTKLGTYIFAAQYYEKANQLAVNYMNLINKSKMLIRSLLKSSDQGLSSILKDPKEHKNKYSHFEKNLFTLETKVAKGTTVVAQLDFYCDKAIASMNKYQQAMKKLSLDLQAGQAQRELHEAMQDLLQQMDYMNTVLPSILDELQHGKLASNNLEIIPCASNSEEICDIKMQVKKVEQQLPLVKTNRHRFFSQQLQTCLVRSQQQMETDKEIQFDYGQWDEQVRLHPETGEPIYRYRVFLDQVEVASGEFLGESLTCFSTKGVLGGLDLTEDRDIEDMGDVLPPTFTDKVLFSAALGSAHGFLRGTRKLVGVSLEALGVPPKIANVTSHLAYYGSLFNLNFYLSYEQLNQIDEVERCWQAAYEAAFETGKIWLLQMVLGKSSEMLESLGDWLHDWGLETLGRGVKKGGSLLGLGFYAYQFASGGFTQAGAGLIAGTTTELATEKAGRYMLGRALSNG